MMIRYWMALAVLAGSVAVVFGEIKIDGDFINTAPDRFRVMVTDSRPNVNSFTVTVGDRNVMVYKTGTGTFISTNLILVSNEEDRDVAKLLELTGDFVLANSLSSRMILMSSLDDNLTASYNVGGASASTSVSIGVDVKSFTVIYAVMKDANGNVSQNLLDRVNRDIKVHQESKAQANIKVEARIVEFDMPDGVKNLPNQTWYIQQGSDSPPYMMLSKEATNIIHSAKSASQNSQDVHVIYVQYLDLNSTTVSLNGYAITESNFLLEFEDAACHGTAFVSTNYEDPYTPAHETVHLLFGGGGHVNELWNLMYANPRGTTGPSGTKRLTQTQVDTMRTSAEGNRYLK